MHDMDKKFKEGAIALCLLSGKAPGKDKDGDSKPSLEQTP